MSVDLFERLSCPLGSCYARTAVSFLAGKITLPENQNVFYFCWNKPGVLCPQIKLSWVAWRDQG